MPDFDFRVEVNGIETNDRFPTHNAALKFALEAGDPEADTVTIIRHDLLRAQNVGREVIY